MPSVNVREMESFEAALKMFKKQCEREGILSEIKKREHYEKPSVKRKKKILAAKKKISKKNENVIKVVKIMLLIKEIPLKESP